MLFPHMIYFYLYILMFNALALYTSRGLLKMWSPRGLFLIRMPPPAMLGLLWVYLQLPKAKQSIAWERLFSTTRSYVCSSPLHFYASFPLTRLVHVDIHVPAWLDSPSPLAAGKQAWDGLDWDAEWEWRAWECLLVHRGRGRSGSKPVIRPAPHFALESLSFPDIKN